MTILERLLRTLVGSHAGDALVGDLREEALRSGASPTWLIRQMLAHLLAAARVGVRRSASRALMTVTLALGDTIRSARRFPGSTTLAFLIVTLSIAAATVTFSVVDTVVLRRLPFPDDHRLVAIQGSTPRDPFSRIVSPADYYAWRDGSRSFEALAAWTVRSATADLGGGTEEVLLALTTANMFGVLRAQPIMGRTFGEQHERPGSDSVLLIGHGLWKRRFGGDPGIVGRSVSIDGARATILGIMPQGFAFPIDDEHPVEIWRPLVIPLESHTITAESGRSSYLEVIGRLRDTATLDAARAEVEAASGRLGDAFPIFYEDWRVRVASFRDSLAAPVRGWMLLALGAVVLLILLACANVANLLLARFDSRSRDMAIRSSLGASRAQLVLLQLVESLVLACAATSAGVVAAYASLGLVRALLPEGIARSSEIAVDTRVLAAASLAAILTGLLFGALPAWRASRADIVETLKEAGSGGPRSRRWRAGLLVGETALVSALLVVTTLVVGSLVRVLQADLGFDRRPLLTVRLAPSFPELPPQERQARARELFRHAVETLRTTPGVTHVAALGGGPTPLGSGHSATFIETAIGRVPVEVRRASPGYFETAGIPLLSGRDFTPSDQPGGRPVIVIDALAARQLFGSADPVDREVRFAGGKSTATIIGVVGHVKLRGPEGEAGPQLYHPLPQRTSNAEILVRTSVPPGRAVRDVTAVVTGLVPAGSPAPVVTSLEDRFRELTAARRFSASIVGGFGLLALVIGVVGIYGITASVVAQQARDIGIRMALGAASAQVVRGIATGTLRLLGAGGAVGLGAAWAMSGLFESLVFGIDPSEALPYLLPFAVLACLGLLAAMVPAVRASRIDPLIVLRRE